MHIDVLQLLREDSSKQDSETRVWFIGFFFFFSFVCEEMNWIQRQQRYKVGPKNVRLHCSDNRNVKCGTEKRGNLSILENQHNLFLFCITFVLIRNAYHQPSD